MDFSNKINSGLFSVVRVKATKSFNNTDLVEILISVETIFPFISDKIEISEFIYSKGKFLPL